MSSDLTSQIDAAPSPGADAPLHDGTGLVFIVGAPRSGTTWLQRLLASHPRVRTGQESELFTKFIGPMLRMWRRQVERELSEETATGRGGTGLPCYMTEDRYVLALRRHLTDLLAAMGAEPGADTIFLEKTPDHASFVPEIKALLPNAKIVHIIRDPRDVVTSTIAASQSWGAAWASTDALVIARRWHSLVTMARAAGAPLGPSDYRELRYEDLLAAPMAELEPLFAFIGAPWPREEVERAVERNSAKAMKAGGGTEIRLGGEAARRGATVVREPAGFTRAARDGGWRAELGLRQKVAVWRATRRVIADFGYSWPARDWLRS